MKYLVLKHEDIEKYLNRQSQYELSLLCKTIETMRKLDGKDINNYFVVNADEPYANEVREIIKKHEGECDL